jgi:hypothetical protein
VSRFGDARRAAIYQPGARPLFVFGFGEAALALLGPYYLARSREHHVRQSSAHGQLRGSATA